MTPASTPDDPPRTLTAADLAAIRGIVADAEARVLLQVDQRCADLAAGISDRGVRAAAWGLLAQIEAVAIEQRAVEAHAEYLKEALD